ncbi:MAG TPA: DUF126 domain-containing protein [Vicinamibacterales bacterium]|nr:DUF126 domain-containing protein [Vicinamibacterales bacterium]
MTRAASALARGVGAGTALVLTEPLSLWGGVEVESGRIVDRSHPQCGEHVAGRVLVMSGGRGSSSSSAVLAEAIRLGTAPCAIVLSVPDPILTVGAIVAEFLYHLRCPIVVCPIEGISTGDHVQVVAGDAGAATVTWTPRAQPGAPPDHPSPIDR